MSEVNCAWTKEQHDRAAKDKKVLVCIAWDGRHATGAKERGKCVAKLLVTEAEAKKVQKLFLALLKSQKGDAALPEGKP